MANLLSLKVNNTSKYDSPIYLNNAATSFPKAPGMGKEVAAFLEKIPRHPGRSGAAGEDTLWLCRKELAELLKVNDPRQIVLCKNATEALNIAIHGIGLERGDVVVTSAAEHNSVLRPLYLLEKKGIIKIRIIPCDAQGRVITPQWMEAIDTLSPRLVILNHASNVTGAVNPAAVLLKYAGAKGCLTLLDASQTMGLLDIDASQLPVDIVAFTGHKYLLGPPGTGGLYVKKGIDIEPVFVGGTGIRSDLKEMPPEMPGRLEPGSPNLPMFAGLLYSLKWQKANPAPLKKIEILTQTLEEGLFEKGAQVTGTGSLRTPSVSFCLPGWDIKEIGYILEKSFNIICRTGLHCAPLIHRWIGTAPEGSIRFSLSRFTTDAEVAYILGVIEKLVHSAPHL
jgi:selenocysteine lyase/cysteine desulfurase